MSARSVNAGTLTTCQVALDNGRDAIGIELNPGYIALGRERCGLFAQHEK